MISQAAEYALRAVMCLATRAPNGSGGMTTHALAEAATLPVGYLAKIMQTLVRAGIVHSQRGVNGGFTLARPPEVLTLLDIVQAVEPSRRITACPIANPAHADNLCPLHQRLDQAAAAVEELLGSTTLAQLASESQAHALLCSDECAQQACTAAPARSARQPTCSIND